MTKRIVSLIMAMMLVLGIVPISAADVADGDYTYEIYDGEATITGYTGTDKNIELPATLDGYPITKIGAGAFNSRDHLESVVIPEGVTYIGTGAFSSCQNLNTVVISSEVEFIENYAFKRCDQLTEINIPGSVKVLYNEAFGSCINLGTATFNNPRTVIIGRVIMGGVGALFHPAFYNSPNLKTIYGYYGSTAEEFANEQDATFIPLPKVQIGEEQLLFDIPAQFENGRVLVPMRAVFEAFGAQVGWDEATQTITAIKGDTQISLQIDSSVVTVNGIDKELDVPARMVSDRTMVPIRAISEALGADVQWDQNAYAVTITP